MIQLYSRKESIKWNSNLMIVDDVDDKSTNHWRTSGGWKSGHGHTDKSSTNDDNDFQKNKNKRKMRGEVARTHGARSRRRSELNGRWPKEGAAVGVVMSSLPVNQCTSLQLVTPDESLVDDWMQQRRIRGYPCHYEPRSLAHTHPLTGSPFLLLSFPLSNTHTHTYTHTHTHTHTNSHS